MTTTTIFKCSNPSCEEEWDVNSKGYLIPGLCVELNKTDNGWISIAEVHNDCPSCNDEWKWSE